MKRSYDGPDHSMEIKRRPDVVQTSAADAIRAAAQAAALQAQILSKTGGTNTLTIKCPQSAVGKVIGKRGESIAQLQAQTQCNVQVDQTTKEAGYSTLHLSAKTREALMKCKVHLEALIASTQPLGESPSFEVFASTATQESEATEQTTIDIPEASVGILIGPKGIVIHQMMMEFEVHMWIDQTMPPGQPRKLAVLGPKQNCEKALQRINDILTGKFNPAQSAIENSVSTNYYKYQTQILQAFQDTANAEAVMERHVLKTSAEWIAKIQGKRGQLLQQIKAQSSAQIEIKADDEGCVIQVSGPSFAATRALQLIRERIPQEHLHIVQAPEANSEKAWFDQPWNASTKISAEEATALAEDWQKFSINSK